jgi:hypothetical protein
MKRQMIMLVNVSLMTVILTIAVISLLSGPSVVHALCQAPDAAVLNTWVNLANVLSDEGILHRINIMAGCGDHVLCPAGDPSGCQVSGSTGFGADLTYACERGECNMFNVPLYIEQSGRRAWLTTMMGEAEFTLSARVIPGELRYEQLAVYWSVRYPKGSGRRDFERTEYFIQAREVVPYRMIFREQQRLTVTPTPTLTTPPAPTNTPVPTNTLAPFQILAPAYGACLEQSAQFEWVDNIGLPAGHVYEIVVWRSGEDPFRHSRGMTQADTRTSRLIDLNYLDDQREWFAPGEYEWGVFEITTEPYQRVRLLGSSKFTFVRGAPCR